jgi:hypothetical protein
MKEVIDAVQEALRRDADISRTASSRSNLAVLGRRLVVTGLVSGLWLIRFFRLGFLFGGLLCSFDSLAFVPFETIVGFACHELSIGDKTPSKICGRNSSVEHTQT